MLVLISFPSLFVRLLPGVELSESGQIVGRLGGAETLNVTARETKAFVRPRLWAQAGTHTA